MSDYHTKRFEALDQIREEASDLALHKLKDVLEYVRTKRRSQVAMFKYKKCAACGKDIYGKSMYCDNKGKCKQKAYRLRVKARKAKS